MSGREFPNCMSEPTNEYLDLLSLQRFKVRCTLPDYMIYMCRDMDDQCASGDQCQYAEFFPLVGPTFHTRLCALGGYTVFDIGSLVC